MGHTFREMDPAGAERQDTLMARRSTLMKRVQEIPLSRLTLGDIRAFINVIRPEYSGHTFDERDAETLEGIINRSTF